MPGEALNEDRLQESFGSEAQKLWVVRDCSALEKLVAERNDRAMKLETAQIQLSMEGNKRRLAKMKGDGGSETSGNRGMQSFTVPYQSRPKHRSIPILGQKVDTIDWARKTLPNLQGQVRNNRATAEWSAKPETSAAFVAYSSPDAAQQACRDIKFHRVVSVIAPDRLLGFKPKEAHWANLSLAPSRRIPQAAFATALVIATILFWVIPIGFVGAISNVKYLADKVKFLRFLNDLPPSVIGLLSGLLPPLAISTLVSYVPKIFRCEWLIKTWVPFL